MNLSSMMDEFYKGGNQKPAPHPLQMISCPGNLSQGIQLHNANSEIVRAIKQDKSKEIFK